MRTAMWLPLLESQFQDCMQLVTARQEYLAELIAMEA